MTKLLNSLFHDGVDKEQKIFPHHFDDVHQIIEAETDTEKKYYR